MTPHRTAQLCRWVLAFAVPATAFLLFAWATRIIPDTRPFVWLMVYLTGLFFCMATGLALTLATLQMATVDAFAAGYRTAMKDVARITGRTSLRSVE